MIRMAFSSILVWKMPITVVRASHQPVEPATTPATTKPASWKLPAPPANPPSPAEHDAEGQEGHRIGDGQGEG